MSIMSVVIKIFRVPSRQDIVLKSQLEPVERYVDLEFQDQTRENRNVSPHQDQVARLRAVTWVGRRTV